jgi:hypothetical protein
LVDGRIPPEVATTVIAAIERGDLEGAAATLKDFAKTNPVDIDFTPKGVDKLEEAVGKITDLPRVYDPLIAATGGYTEANLDALDAVLGLGDAYQGTLSQLASTAEPAVVREWAEKMREDFAGIASQAGITGDELEAYYQLLGIAPDEIETAIKISIDEAELFALTTTIELLTGLDELSPEDRQTVALKAFRDQLPEEERPQFEEKSATFIVGSTLPVWHRIPFPFKQVKRVNMDDGSSFLGVLVPEAKVDETRSRPEHMRANGQTVPLDQPFIIGGIELDTPGDQMAGAPHQTINCRCIVVFVYD